MGIIQTMLRQTATYWPPAGYDEDGQEIMGTPETLKVRWEDTTLKFMDEGGNEKISNALVYVEKDVETGGWLALGDRESESMSHPSSPEQLRPRRSEPRKLDSGRTQRRAGSVDPLTETRYRIMKFEKTPNLKATQTLRAAFL